MKDFTFISPTKIYFGKQDKRVLKFDLLTYNYIQHNIKQCFRKNFNWFVFLVFGFPGCYSLSPL